MQEKGVSKRHSFGWLFPFFIFVSICWCSIAPWFSKYEITPGVTVTPSLSVAQVIPTILYDMRYTLTPRPVFPSAVPIVSSTPSPTLTAVNLSPKVSLHLLSYYDPDCGYKGLCDVETAKVNCAVLRADLYCLSGLSELKQADFRPYYMKAAACPKEYSLRVFTVLYPDQLRGTWFCADTGDLVVGQYIDFLVPMESIPSLFPGGFPWSSTVVVSWEGFYAK